MQSRRVLGEQPAQGFQVVGYGGRVEGALACARPRAGVVAMTASNHLDKEN